MVAFSPGLRRPSGSCLPSFDATCAGGALGKRPGVEPHPFVVLICADLDSADAAAQHSANPLAQPSAEQQFWAEMQHAEAELASGAAATAAKRLEAALARLKEERLPSHLRGQLQLALGLSCAAQAKHDDAHRWFERCARALSARGGSSSTSTFAPVFNQALQLAALGRCDTPSPPRPRLPTLASQPSPARPSCPFRACAARRSYPGACALLCRASRQLEDLALGMRGAALLAMRLQLLLAQAACAHGAAPKAGDEAAQGSARGAARGGRGGRGGCPGHHEPARTAQHSAAQHSTARHSAACARALHRALSLLEGAGAACLEELGRTHAATHAAYYPLAASLASQAAGVAGPGREGAAACTAGLGDSGPPALDAVPPSALAMLGEQLQACALLQRGSLAAPCHRHALRLLGTAREQLRCGEEARLAAGRQQGRPRPQQGGVASELAHLCGRLAVSSFALGRQQEGASWLKEAAQHLLRTPPSRASSSASSSRAEHAQLSSQLEQEHHPLALARMCSSLRTSRA